MSLAKPTDALAHLNRWREFPFLMPRANLCKSASKRLRALVSMAFPFSPRASLKQKSLVSSHLTEANYSNVMDNDSYRATGTGSAMAGMAIANAVPTEAATQAALAAGIGVSAGVSAGTSNGALAGIPVLTTSTKRLCRGFP